MAAASLRTWVLAIRPKTLWSAFAPVIMGGAIAYADDVFHAGYMLAALAAAYLIQIGTNLCNDYCDFQKGTDNEERVGPLRVTQAGLLSPATVLKATILTFGMAAVLCLLLVLRGGWPIVVIGAVSILCGIWYTAGRYSMGYLGLGDVFVLIFFGPVAVAGTYYLQALDWSMQSVFAGLGAGLLSVAVLSVNNLRDREGDARSGKKTLAVRFGVTFARLEYTACLLAAPLIASLLALRTGAHGPVHACWLIWIPGWPLLRKVWGGAEGAALNPVLGGTARLLLVYALIFSAGWAW